MARIVRVHCAGGTLRANIAAMQAFLLEVIAIVGATVHTEDGRASAVATVIVDGATIRAVGPDEKIPEGARRIDASGKHLVPGLIDGFAYHDSAHDLLYVASGVTTIADHGNDLSRIFDQRDARARDRVPGPALVTAGAVIDGVPPATNSALMARDAKELDALVQTLFAQDDARRVDFLAFQTNLPLEAWKKLVAVAHEKQVEVWGPPPRAGSLAECVSAGQTGILFLDGFLASGEGWDTVGDLSKLAEPIRSLARAKVAVVPLLRGVARLAETPEHQQDELLDYSPQFASQWAGEWNLRSKIPNQAQYRANAAKVLEKERALVAKLFAAGVELVPGSGAPHPWLSPGVGLVRELVEWQVAGIPAKEILRMATAGNAKHFGIGERTGRIASGMRADLLLVDSDPELAIANLSSVAGVMVRGQWLDRATLDKRHAELRAAQQEALNQASHPLPVGELLIPEGKLLMRGYTETAANGVRTAGERWAVVEDPHGGTVFVSRRLTPGSEGHDDADVSLSQRVVDGQLDSFTIALKSGKHELSVRGAWTAEALHVERRLDGAFIDNKTASLRVSCVDVDSVTSFMLLHRFFPKREEVGVVRFYTGLELEIVKWVQTVDAEGRSSFKTPSGGKLADFAASKTLSKPPTGALVALYEQKGSGAVETRTLLADGAGFADGATRDAPVKRD